MTWSLRRTELASDDLLEIWLYIAAENPQAADKLLYGLDSAFRLVADFPRIGKPIDDIAPDHRTLVHGHYLLVYRVDETARVCELVRVVHGARRWADLIG